MSNVLIKKLENFGPLSEEDRSHIRRISARPHIVEANTDIIREGDRPSKVQLIMSGFACRYKILPDRSRQIVGFLVPGDFCDLHVFILDAMDHSIATLAKTALVSICRNDILSMIDRPAISRALLLSTLVDEAVLREWLVNIGQRPAEQRIAHLFCEMFLRLEVVGMANGTTFKLPVTQADIGDAVGLSTVHVNRSLQALKEQGLITFRRGAVVIPDMALLRAASGFRSNYLHLKHVRPTDANAPAGGPIRST